MHPYEVGVWRISILTKLGSRQRDDRSREAHSLAASPSTTTRREACRVAAQEQLSPKHSPPKPAARSRLLIGECGPSDSARAAARGWRLLAAQPLTGTRRAALLGTCARAAPLGAIRPRRTRTGT